MNNSDSRDCHFVSIRQIAEKLGISKSAVSLALNNSARIKKETVKLVKDTAKSIIVTNDGKYLKNEPTGNILPFRSQEELYNYYKNK